MQHQYLIDVSLRRAVKLLKKEELEPTGRDSHVKKHIGASWEEIFDCLHVRFMSQKSRTVA